MVLEIKQEDFEKEIVSSDIPVIIDFYADWCGPCQMMKPLFENVSLQYKGKLKFVKVNTEISPELAEKYEISGIPCLVITNHGEEIDRIIGYRQESELKKSIDSILQKI